MTTAFPLVLLMLCAFANIWLSAANTCPSPPGYPGRDGRDGRDGIPGPAGPPGPSGSPGQCECDGSDQDSGSPVVIKKVMTPRKLQGVASLWHLASASDTELQFRVAGTIRSRLLSFPLDSLGTIPPETLNNLTISIQAHFLRSATSDNDPFLALCDGTTCNGIAFSDRGNYPAGPCGYFTMTPGPVATNVVASLDRCGGETVETTFAHPKTITLSFIPSERWGSFSIPEGNGFTTSDIFGTQLDPTRGLTVEMYGFGTNEQYRLAYMIVEVIREE